MGTWDRPFQLGWKINNKTSNNVLEWRLKWG